MTQKTPVDFNLFLSILYGMKPKLNIETEMMLKRANVIWNDELCVWEAWDESSSVVVCSSPYLDIAHTGAMWYAGHILEGKRNVQ